MGGDLQLNHRSSHVRWIVWAFWETVQYEAWRWAELSTPKKLYVAIMKTSKSVNRYFSTTNLIVYFIYSCEILFAIYISSSGEDSFSLINVTVLQHSVHGDMWPVGQHHGRAEWSSLCHSVVKSNREHPHATELIFSNTLFLPPVGELVDPTGENSQTYVEYDRQSRVKCNNTGQKSLCNSLFLLENSCH